MRNIIEERVGDPMDGDPAEFRTLLFTDKDSGAFLGAVETLACHVDKTVRIWGEGFAKHYLEQNGEEFTGIAKYRLYHGHIADQIMEQLRADDEQQAGEDA
jgi:hypothetical protein